MIFKDQYSKIFVHKYSNNFRLWKLPWIEYEYQYLEENIRIFEYIRIFVRTLPLTWNPIFFFFPDSKCSCGEGERPDINRSRKEAIRYKKVLASHKRKEMKKSKDDRIVNGFRDDSQHWMATFARNKRIFCGGAIISHRYIV